MDTIDFTATTRVPKGKGAARQLRAKGMIPGMLYGDGQENVAVGVKPRAVIDVLRSERGANSILNIEVDGTKQLGIIRDYQVHPVRRKLLHIDLLRVQPKTVLKVGVPIKIVGRSMGEDRGAKLILASRELKVLCALSQIPDSIEIDVTNYDEGFTFYSRDLDLPEELKLVARGNFPIFSILVPRAILEFEETEEEEEEGEEGEEGAEGAEGAKGGAEGAKKAPGAEASAAGKGSAEKKEN